MNVIRRVRQISLSLALIMGFGFAVMPALAHADTAKSVVCNSIGGGADCTSNSSGGTDLNKIISVTVNIMSIAVGILAVIMIIISGFRFVTSGGDSNKVGSAKNTIIYAIVGLVIAVMAQFIVHFVLQKATAPTCGVNQVVSNTNNACVAAPKK